MIRCESKDRNFMIYLNFDVIISKCRASKFSSDLTIISYFNIIVNINIITNPTFSRVLVFTVSVQPLLSLIILLIKSYTASHLNINLKGLLNLSSTDTNL